MNTFSVTLSDSAYTEVLGGFSTIAFDIKAQPAVTILFTETNDTPDPSTVGNNLRTWNDGWDFQGSGFEAGIQRIWLKGDNSIVGVRG